jgi:hypothetical protein
MYRDYDTGDPDSLNVFISDFSDRHIPMDTVKYTNDESQSGLRAVSNSTTSIESITDSNSLRLGSTGAFQTSARASFGRISQVPFT